MESREIENADGSRPLSVVARSLSTWFEREASILRGAIAIAREHLAVHPDEGETRMSLAELEQQREQLYRGWENSTLRRHIEDRPQQHAAAGGMERRVAAAAGLPLAVGARATEISSTLTATRLEGYAAVYDVLSPDWAGFRERIEREAFRPALETSDIRLLYNHDSNHLFARSSAATMEVSQDAHGLHFRAFLLPYDGLSYHLARLVDRRDLSGCSFSFTGVKDRWILKPGQTDIRIIEEISTVFDVGPVAFPWYPTTNISAVFESVKRSAPPAAGDDSGVGNDEFYAELDQLDEQIERDDRLLAQQRERDRKFDYQEMGRIIRAVECYRTLQSS